MICNDEVVSYGLLKRVTKPLTVVIDPRNQAAVLHRPVAVLKPQLRPPGFTVPVLFWDCRADRTRPKRLAKAPVLCYTPCIDLA